MNGILNIKTEANYEIAEKVVTLKDELKQLEDEYNEKYTRRSNEINEIITIELRCESLLRQNEELKGKLVQVENERDQSVEKLIKLKKSNTQLESKVRQANSEIAERATTCEYVKKRENELNEEINALKKTNLTLETSLKEETRKSQNVLDLLTNLKKEAQEQQEKFDLKSYRQQKFINDLKAKCSCNEGHADTLRLLRAEIDAEKTLNATQQKILDEEKHEKEKLKARIREFEEKFLLLQMNVVQNRAIYDSKQADMIKKMEAEKRAKLAIEEELNDSREANLRMAANNRFLKEKIASVSRLEERIDELEERRKKTIHENNKVLEEISRLTSKRIANLNKMRETIEDNHTRNKRKSSECEIVSATVKSKKASN